jgi:ectoine hydroxylase-related dioxygenase (phytanoyl-CoA dioxygenase family)
MKAFTLDAGAAAAEVNDRFNHFGIVVLKGLLPQSELAEQRRAIAQLLALRLQSLGESPDGNIDVSLNRLLRIDRGHAMDIIRAIKDSPFFYRSLADERLQAVARACLSCDTLMAVHDLAQFRIDPPNDDVRNFAWHQDFQYNVTSLNAVTVWYPLTAVSDDMGPLVVVPGSHLRILPVEMDFSEHRPGTGTAHSTVRFDAGDAERQAVALRGLEEGDVVLFHSLMVHRSSPNRSTRARWTFNPRFSDGADPEFVSRGWLAVRDKTQDLFAKLYPDLVRNGQMKS